MERMAKVDPTVMIDSVIMIDHFNGIPAATNMQTNFTPARSSRLMR